MEAPDLTSFRPLTTRARLVTACLGLYGITLAATIVNGLRAISLHQRILDGQFVTEAEITAFYAAVDSMNWAGVALLVLSAIFFLSWLHRASRNAKAIGVRPMRWGTGWAMGGFFVPVISMWRPYQVITEIWRVSEPRRDGEDVDMPGLVPVPKLFPVWWAAWLLGNMIGFASLRAHLAAHDSSDVIAATRLDLVASSIDIVAIVLVLAIVGRLTRRQDERAASVGGVVPEARVI